MRVPVIHFTHSLLSGDHNMASMSCIVECWLLPHPHTFTLPIWLTGPVCVLVIFPVMMEKFLRLGNYLSKTSRDCVCL